jgi:hypothetical protein
MQGGMLLAYVVDSCIPLIKTLVVEIQCAFFPEFYGFHHLTINFLE